MTPERRLEVLAKRQGLRIVELEAEVERLDTENGLLKAALNTEQLADDNLIQGLQKLRDGI